MLVVQVMLVCEWEVGLECIEGYVGFQVCVEEIKLQLLFFLLEQKCVGKKVLVYGVVVKGNMLFNYFGVYFDLLVMVVDVVFFKQDKYMLGSYIFIVFLQCLFDEKLDVVLILFWNIKDEVVQQLGEICVWGGCFVIVVLQFQVW